MSTPGTIVVVGSLNLDLVVQVERLPSSGETVHGDSIERIPGGKGANQAIAAARLGAPVAMIGRVGTDAAGETLRSALRESGIDDHAVLTSAGATTGTALIHTDRTGQNSITVIAGANALLTPADLDVHVNLIASASMVLAQLETPMETVERLGELCHANGVPLMLDPAPAQPLSESLVRAVTWLTPTESEAAALCGATPMDDDETLVRLRGSGARNVVLKQGQRGVLIATESGKLFRSAAFAVEAVDTTAAGDCFNAAFAVALHRGQSAEEAARFANASAALSTTRHGAQPSLPTLSDVEALLAFRSIRSITAPVAPATAPACGPWSRDTSSAPQEIAPQSRSRRSRTAPHATV